MCLLEVEHVKSGNISSCLIHANTFKQNLVQLRPRFFMQVANFETTLWGIWPCFVLYVLGLKQVEFHFSTCVGPLRFSFGSGSGYRWGALRTHFRVIGHLEDRWFVELKHEILRCSRLIHDLGTVLLLNSHALTIQIHGLCFHMSLTFCCWRVQELSCFLYNVVPKLFEGLKKLLVGRPKCGRSIWANLGFYRLSWQRFKYAAPGSKVNGFKISDMRLFSLKICLLPYFLQISADDTSCRLPTSPTKIGCWARSIKGRRRFTGNRDAEDCPRIFPKVKIGWPIDRKMMGHLDVKFLFASKTAFEWMNFGCFQGI